MDRRDYGILRSLKNIRDLLDSVHTVRRRQELLDEETDLLGQLDTVRDDMKTVLDADPDTDHWMMLRCALAHS